MKRIFILLICFITINVFSQTPGCTDSLALNYNPLATDDDGSCLYCSSLADFGADTIQSCDSVEISVVGLSNATYNWNTSNIFTGQNVQHLLDVGYTPYEVYSLISSSPTNGDISSLYGNIYQGGYLFYLDTISKAGFIAAPNDESICEWGLGCIVGSNNGISTSDDLFTGQTNTNLILASSGLTCSNPNIAAALCDSSIQSGYIDWFLPSFNELNELHDNLTILGNINFASDFYWSSTEDDVLINLYTEAKGRNFINGLVQTMPKNHTHSVRPVRDYNNSGSNTFSILNSGWNEVTIQAFGCTSTDSIYVELTCYGCTDSLALNYDSLASLDDGSCISVIYGCTDSTALNYDLSANIDDGSCCYLLYGCTDPNTCNYNPCAIMDDGSCIYGSWPGCTDSLAYNYDPLAMCDNGTCLYCTHSNLPPTALSFNWTTDSKAEISWNNMNDSCNTVLKYYVRYRELGSPSWITKSAGVGNGLCNFGLNTINKILQNLSSGTTYEYKMKTFYCGGLSSSYSTPSQFTTAIDCPEMTNLTAITFNGNQSKVRFDWDTLGAYVFARIALRLDTAGANWQTAGGFGVYYPTLSVNKFGLQSGDSYIAQGRTFCDINITSYRSWWTAPIFWTQPGTIKLDGGKRISNFNIYPNPSRDIFNISFNSEYIQDLSIRIFNVLGVEVYIENKDQFIGEFTKKINLDDYGKGIYFLEINSGNLVVKKIIIFQ
ncbi:MAG: hypothetical protein ACI84S_000574 [Thalassomonas sp.]|jgi:hypothetical protein|tara:strand:- start:858 stop:3014 length:2157 start_codon:yes stop_codon:yes gene_type:complete